MLSFWPFERLKLFVQLKEGIETEPALQQRLAATTKFIIDNYINSNETDVVVLVGHAATTITSTSDPLPDLLNWCVDPVLSLSGTRGVLALNHEPIPQDFFHTEQGRPFVNSGVCSIVRSLSFALAWRKVGRFNGANIGTIRYAPP